MPPSRDDILPFNVGHTLVESVLKLTESVGRVEGKVDGLNEAVGALGARVSQSVTRDECAAYMTNTKPRIPTGGGYAAVKAAADEANGWWKRAQTRIAVIAGAVALLGLVVGAMLWMVNTYSAIQAVQAAQNHQVVVDKKK
jgi:hypothetical protein